MLGHAAEWGVWERAELGPVVLFGIQ
jgi:hypothetical protein